MEPERTLSRFGEVRAGARVGIVRVVKRASRFDHSLPVIMLDGAHRGVIGVFVAA